jgi:hypothetical protein
MFDSNSTVEDIGAIEGLEATAGFLLFDGSERLLCCLIDPKGGSHLFVHSLAQERRMYSHMWGHFLFGPIDPLDTVIKDDRAIAGAANPLDSRVYLVTAAGILHRVELDNGKVERLGAVPPQNLSAVLACDPSTGNLYGVSGRGRLWRWDGSEVTVFDARVPTMKNRDYAASCSSLVWHDGKIYGEGRINDYLSCSAPES